MHVFCSVLCISVLHAHAIGSYYNEIFPVAGTFGFTFIFHAYFQWCLFSFVGFTYAKIKVGLSMRKLTVDELFRELLLTLQNVILLSSKLSFSFMCLCGRNAG